jgi:hypothetical protein
VYENITMKLVKNALGGRKVWMRENERGSDSN